MNRKSKLFKGLSLGVASIMTFGLFTSISNVFASTGDFSSDFVAAAPSSYSHLTGGGAFDDRTIGKSADVVESLEAGDFKSYDVVTFFHQIEVAELPAKGDDSPQTIEMDYSFLADATGTSGAGFSKIVGFSVNRGTIVDLTETDQIDQGNIEVTPDSTVTAVGNPEGTMVGTLFTPKSVLKLTLRLDGLEYTETIIVRIDAEIRFKPGANPTGNIAASVDAMRLVAIDGGTAVTKRNAIPTGAQTVPFKLNDYSLPLIAINKTTWGWNGTTNVWADGVSIKMGDPVKWRYAVTNPGTLPLSNVVVRDDNGTPSNLTDDFTVTGPLSGDTDSDGKLDSGETWLYEYTSPAGAVRGTYNNIATATGSDGTRTTDPATDPSSYFGVDSQIQVVKTTWGWKGMVEAYDDDVYIQSGTTVKWRYVVTNPGNVPLSNVEVWDNNGTTTTSDDFQITSTPTGDTDGDGKLDLTETWTYLYEEADSAIIGAYTNLGTATGKYLGSFTAQDTDPSNYTGVDSQLRIQKTTRDARVVNNGAYMDDAKLVAGQTVMWKYAVTNPGNYPMSGVTITDDNGTPSETADDFSPTYSSGDTDGDGKLDPDTNPAEGYQGETWIYYQTSSTAAVSGTYSNTAAVEGTGLGIGLAQDDDTSNYTGYNISIRVTKVFTAGPFANTQYPTYKIENTSSEGTPDDFMVTAKIYDKKLGIDQTVELLAGEFENITLGTPVPANTEQPYVDASIIIFDDEATAETIHFYGEP